MVKNKIASSVFKENKYFIIKFTIIIMIHYLYYHFEFVSDLKIYFLIKKNTLSNSPFELSTMF